MKTIHVPKTYLPTLPTLELLERKTKQNKAKSFTMLFHLSAFPTPPLALGIMRQQSDEFHCVH